MDHSAYFWQVQAGKLPKPLAAQTLGMTVGQIDQQTCTLQATFEVKPEFTNPAWHVQGGFLSSMLDDAMGSALAAIRAAGEFAPTVHLSIQFILAARPWELHTMRQVVRRGCNICHLYGELFQRGGLIATTSATATIRKL